MFQHTADQSVPAGESSRNDRQTKGIGLEQPLPVRPLFVADEFVICQGTPAQLKRCGVPSKQRHSLPGMAHFRLPKTAPKPSYYEKGEVIQKNSTRFWRGGL